MSAHVRSAGGVRRSRAEWYAIVKPLRDEGLTGLEIARQTGLASTWVYELLKDPDGAKAKARKDANRKPCVKCGCPTSPETLVTGLCRSCYVASVARKCGTRSGYQGGCRCDACTAAAAAAMRAWRRRNR